MSDVIEEIERQLEKLHAVRLARDRKSPQHYWKKLQEQRGEYIWLRLGDRSNYEKFFSIDGAVQDIETLVDLMVKDGWPRPEKFRWKEYGLEIPALNLDGQNYISIFWGDEDAQPVRDLDRREKMQVERELEV